MLFSHEENRGKTPHFCHFGMEMNEFDFMGYKLSRFLADRRKFLYPSLSCVR